MKRSPWLGSILLGASLAGCSGGALAPADGGDGLLRADGGEGGSIGGGDGGMNDGGGGANEDAGSSGVTDAGGGGGGNEDAGTIVDDAGAAGEDAGTIVDDAGTVGDDAGSAGEDAGSAPSTGELWFISYNVAGLPQGLSSSDPSNNIPLIGPLLDAYDLAVVQEDFWYHDELSSGVTLPYRSTPMVEDPSLIPPNLGDGLNRFSRFPLGPLTRTTWSQCSGYTDCSNDCPADKGFSVSTVELASGVTVDVYNLHMDAGSCDGDFEARASGAEELAAFIASRSAGRAIIVAGDTNLNMARPPDDEILAGLLEDTGLEVACRLASCDDESIDRIMIRSGTDLTLEVAEWVRPTHFVDGEGNDLSDHVPTTALLRWTRSGASE